MYTIEIKIGGKWETHMTFDYLEDAFDEFEEMENRGSVRLTYEA